MSYFYEEQFLEEKKKQDTNKEYVLRTTSRKAKFYKNEDWHVHENKKKIKFLFDSGGDWELCVSKAKINFKNREEFYETIIKDMDKNDLVFNKYETVNFVQLLKILYIEIVENDDDDDCDIDYKHSNEELDFINKLKNLIFEDFKVVYFDGNFKCAVAKCKNNYYYFRYCTS